MTEQLKEELQNLSKLDGTVIELAKQMLSGPSYPLDYLVGVALNRSLSLINGYTMLISANNFLCAAHLIRPNLDNYLRLNAACLVADPHAFAETVLNGARVKDLRDKGGQKMTDFHLKERASEHHPWIKDIYDDTSGFIHLGNQHVKSSLYFSDQETKTVHGSISREDRFIPDVWKVEATHVMGKITTLICEFVEDWIEIKTAPGSKSTASSTP